MSTFPVHIVRELVLQVRIFSHVCIYYTTYLEMYTQFLYVQHKFIASIKVTMLPVKKAPASSPTS